MKSARALVSVLVTVETSVPSSQLPWETIQERINDEAIHSLRDFLERANFHVADEPHCVRVVWAEDLKK